MAKHNDLGQKGEALSVDYLIKKGYQVLETNWRFQKAEIDIIARLKNTLVVIEVKTRSSNYFGNPEDFISTQKKQLLVKAANEFITTNALDIEVRFDILAVTISQNSLKINHIEDAFSCYEVI